MLNAMLKRPLQIELEEPRCQDGLMPLPNTTYSRPQLTKMLMSKSSLAKEVPTNGLLVSGLLPRKLPTRAFSTMSLFDPLSLLTLICPCTHLQWPNIIIYIQKFDIHHFLCKKCGGNNFNNKKIIILHYMQLK